MLREQAHQAHRFAAQVGAHDGLGARAVVALVEEQVQRAVHRGEAWREVRGGQLEEALRVGEHLLAARQPLLDRRR
jgi:hypothetical protein